VGDEELFEGDVDAARLSGASMLRHLMLIFQQDMRPEEALEHFKHLRDFADEFAKAIERVDGWREWVRDKSVNESALLDQVAQRMHMNSLDASDPMNGDVPPVT
jgi:hypothetical protein